MNRALAVPKGFSLKATVLSHGWHECAPMSWSECGRCFQVIERAGGSTLRVGVSESLRKGRNGRLVISMEAPSVSDEAAHRIVDRVSLTLGLGEDLSEFYALCQEHPRIAVIPRIGGGRLIRSASMTENIIKALCGTNVNWTQAVKMINRIAQLGPHVPHFRSLNAWPTPYEILRAGKGYLDEVCRLGYRTEFVLKFCHDVDSGRFDPERLFSAAGDPSVSSDDLLRALRSIRGIGPSSAHYLLGFLGRHDRLSIDTATVAHVAKAHLKGRKPKARQIERIYAPFGRWKNLVYWCENWLTWATARQIVAESADGRPNPHRSRSV
jgi:N-glycosylase/DNA lyase